jgi:hypothetical protein
MVCFLRPAFRMVLIQLDETRAGALVRQFDSASLRNRSFRGVDAVGTALICIGISIVLSSRWSRPASRNAAHCRSPASRADSSQAPFGPIRSGALAR